MRSIFNQHQELISFLLVGGAFLDLGFRFFKGYLALPLAQWLLQRGQIKWAMYFRHGIK